ncbi:hypothetical protein D3C73_1480020 [compost metagenome]
MPLINQDIQEAAQLVSGKQLLLLDPLIKSRIDQLIPQLRLRISYIFQHEADPFRMYFTFTKPVLLGLNSLQIMD